jgi:capsular exopolysaccharide synthesis family protein
MTDDVTDATVTAVLLDAGVVTSSRPCPIVDSLSDSQSVVAEELRLLRSRLRTAGKAGGARCLALTSALPDEGKSTVALGLAAASAREAGRRVLLVEADVRKPTVSLNLGLSPAPGLCEWLNGRLEQVPIRRIEPAGFSVLVAGRERLERPESLGSPQMGALLQAARSAFDDVIVDVPPLLLVADTILMQDLLDAFILVVRSRATPREILVSALERLHADKVVGVILNDHQEYRNSYSSYAYGRYGMSYGPSHSKGGSRRRR